MTHETDDPRDVADDVQYAPQSIQDSLTTKLTPAEQRLGATSRKVAFCVLAASVLPAAVCAVFWWYMWVVTVQVCLSTYIWRTTDSILLTPGQTKTWQAPLVRLGHIVVFGDDLGPAVHAMDVCGRQELDSVLPARPVSRTSDGPTIAFCSPRGLNRSVFAWVCWVRC